MIDEEGASTLVDTLFRRCSEGDIELRSFLNGSKPHQDFTAVNSPELPKFDLARDIFVGVATRNGGGGKEHIIEIPACWVDIDFKDTPQAEADRLVAEFPHQPTLLVETGGGLHAYWLLTEPVPQSEMALVEQMNHRLADYFGGDHNACDAARILRLPGTLNNKYDPPRPVRILRTRPELEYSLADLDEFLPEAKQTYASRAPSTAPSSGDRLQTILKGCAFLKHCDKDRATLPEAEWFAMITQLCRLPGGPEQIHRLSQGYPKYSREETDRKILHAINSTHGPQRCQLIQALWSGCKGSCGVKAPAALAYSKPKVAAAGPSTFPPGIIAGAAGEFARVYSEYLEPPPHFFYMAYLTCLGSILAGKVTMNSEIEPPPRIYLILLGQSADDRKSTSITKTVDFFRGALTTFQACFGVNSAEGLQRKLASLGDRKNIVLCLDEFKSFVSKCKAENSVLLSCVNTLFEDERYEANTKTHNLLIENAHLSMIAASTIDTYQQCWDSSFTDIGFGNRLFLVTGGAPPKHELPQRIPDHEKARLGKELGSVLAHATIHKQFDLAPDARARWREWYMGREGSIHSRRLDTYGLRLMPLLAVNERKPIVDLEIVEKIVSLLDWELQIRQQYDPIDADNAVAKMEEKIRRAVSAGPINTRDLKRRVHADRSGIWIYEKALSNLKDISRELRLFKLDRAWMVGPAT